VIDPSIYVLVVILAAIVLVFRFAKARQMLKESRCPVVAPALLTAVRVPSNNSDDSSRVAEEEIEEQIAGSSSEQPRSLEL
jgi:hypothetical protein